MANERRFAMAAPVVLRGDYDALTLRRLARSAGDPGQVRRLLALAAIYAGGQRGEAAEIGGVGLQTVRDWVLRFNAEGPAGLETGKAPGNRPILGDRERAALRRIVEDGPIPTVHPAVLRRSPQDEAGMPGGTTQHLVLCGVRSGEPAHSAGKPANNIFNA